MVNEQRLIEIETKLSHQEVLLEELHEALFKQQDVIAKLESTLELFLKRSREAETGAGPIGPGDDKPPHY